MTPPPLIDDAGRAVALGPILGRGGEGAVFSVPADSTIAAKVYHAPPLNQTADKLAAMVRLSNLKVREVAAWPVSLLRHAGMWQVAGFVMPRLTDFQPVQHLYNPVMRLKNFPRAGWAFQVAAAINLTAAFEEVHKTGCLVGDINQSNAFGSGTALVRLIDCDSFQVPRPGQPPFLCEVGVPHYTPPELQGKSLRGVVRTENHDRFGLAVLLYQLLFVGRHPYAGIYRGTGDPSFVQLIANYHFAQGPHAHTWGMSPPPHTPTFADIPPEVGELFRRAFERGGQSNGRPTATEWHATLGRLSKNVATCGADAGHQFWNGQPRCVWCRLATGGGPEYFFGVAGGGGTFAVDEAKLRQTMERLAAVAVPPEIPLPRFTPAPCAPRPLPVDLEPLRRAIEDAKAERDRELARRREAAAVERAKADREREMARRRAAEAIEVAKSNHKQELCARRAAEAVAQAAIDTWAIGEIGKTREKFRAVFANLDEAIEDAKEVVRLAERDNKAWSVVLISGVLLGLLLAPFGFLVKAIGWIGGLVFGASALGLAVFFATRQLSPSHQDLKRARHRRAKTENKLEEATTDIRRRADKQRRKVAGETERVDRELTGRIKSAQRTYEGLVAQEGTHLSVAAYRLLVELADCDVTHRVTEAGRRYRHWLEKIAAERSAALRAARGRLAAIESEWSNAVQMARRRYTELAAQISTAVSGARSLAAEYARDSQLLATGAEALSRMRHMRLHLLADAEIRSLGRIAFRHWRRMAS